MSSYYRTLLPLSVALLLSFPVASVAANPDDRDRDGMSDRWEKANKLNPKANDSRGDADRDGLSNWGEWRARTNPRVKDSDRDRIGDASEDYDRDKLTNGGEIASSTDPARGDSDGDGILDGLEDSDRDGVSNHSEEVEGTHPGKRDSDGDGISDHNEVKGTVTALSADSITLSRRDGTTLILSVDSSTRFRGPDVDRSGKADLADLQVGNKIEAGVSGTKAIKVEFSNSQRDGKGEAKGVVSSINGNAITLKRRDGSDFSVLVDSNTMFRGTDRDSSGSVNLQDLRAGDKVEMYLSSDSSLALMVKFEAEEGEDSDGDKTEED